MIYEMNMNGSKARIASNVINSIVKANITPDMAYIEPFGGGMNSLTRIEHENKTAGDINRFSIAMWNSLKKEGFDGFVRKHSEIINVFKNCREDYDSAKRLYYEMKKDCLSNGKHFDDDILGFVGYACSYGGRWWNGFYGFDKRRANARITGALNSLKKQIESAHNFDKSVFKTTDYREVDIPENSFVYCDPPYDGTKGYSEKFDNAAFWNWCRNLIATKKNVKLLISEYSAPNDFVCIWKKDVQDNLGKNGVKKTEKLFVHKSQLRKFRIPQDIKITIQEISEMVKKVAKNILETMSVYSDII